MEGSAKRDASKGLELQMELKLELELELELKLELELELDGGGGFGAANVSESNVLRIEFLGWTFIGKLVSMVFPVAGE